MPFKSKSQRAFMEMMLKKGKMKKSVVNEFEKATPKGAKLPMHVEKCPHCGGDVEMGTPTATAGDTGEA